MVVPVATGVKLIERYYYYLDLQYRFFFSVIYPKDFDESQRKMTRIVIKNNFTCFLKRIYVKRNFQTEYCTDFSLIK